MKRSRVEVSESLKMIPRPDYLPRRSLTNDSGLNRADSSEITFINICIISQKGNYLLDPRCRERFVINLSRSTRRYINQLHYLRKAFSRINIITLRMNVNL